MDSRQQEVVPLGHAYEQDLARLGQNTGNLTLKRIFLSFSRSSHPPSYRQGKNLAFRLKLFVLKLFWGLKYKIKF